MNQQNKDQDLASVTTEDKQPLTTNVGQPVSDDQNSLKAGSRGPTLLEDYVLREKIQHFDHERIPERDRSCTWRGGAWATSSFMNRSKNMTSGEGAD